MKRALPALVVIVAAMGAGDARPDESLQCPRVLSVSVDRDRYAGWGIYSNDPLRLTGADISYEAEEEATLDPDEQLRLGDSRQTSISVFHLPWVRLRTSFNLQCEYGVHAMLVRTIPSTLSECRVIHYGVYNDGSESEFDAGCR